MKRNFKRRFMTGVAAIALVAPLVLGGISHPNVHAANTSAATHEENMIHNGGLKPGTFGAGNPTSNNSAANPNANANNGNSNNGNNTASTTNNSNSKSNQSGNSSQLAAIKAQMQTQESAMQNNLTQARNKYKSLSKAQQKAQLKTLEANLQKQQQPIQKKLAALQKQYENTLTPKQKAQQKAAQKKQMQQLQNAFKKQQKQEQKKMLKTAQTLFVIQGNKVYTLRTDITKNKQGQEQLQPIPGINKKYYSTKRAFGKKQLVEVRKAKVMSIQARKLHSKTARAKALQRAQNLFVKYARVANMPTPKQQKAEAKKAAQKQKRSQRGRRTHRKRTQRTRQSKRTRKNRSRKSATFKKNGNTVLRSEFRRGSRRKAKAAGFVNGYAYPDGIHTIFNRYRPNSKRAVIPRNLRIYKVNPRHIVKNGKATTWLIGHRTRNEKKISSMKQAYYYNTHDRGWVNIGYGANHNK